jgi:hypothetical protein
MAVKINNYKVEELFWSWVNDPNETLKFIWGLQAFDRHLSEVESSRIDLSDQAAWPVTSRSTPTSSTRMKALKFAALITNELAKTTLRKPEIYRSELAQTNGAEVGWSPQVYLWDHQSHPGWSSWTTSAVDAKKYSFARRAQVRDHFETETDLDGKNFTDILLATKDFAGKVIWAPESAKVLEYVHKELVAFLARAPRAKACQKSHFLLKARDALDQLESNLQTFSDEKEVILFHPHGIKVNIAYVFRD